MTEPARSWGVEVYIIRDDHQLWTGNALRFKTEREAQAYADSRFRSTVYINAWRVFPSRLPPNARWNGRA